MRKLVPAGVMTVGLGTYAVLHRLGRTYGSTAAERRASMPGDDVVGRPQFTSTHGITIDAPPERVWPWLVQMGWHRAGWYTARWVDRMLFPENWPAAERIIAEHQQLAVGDFIPDGPPDTECGFTVVELEANRHLVLHSTTHLPPVWRRERGARMSWTWVFVLQPLDGGRTRFLYRVRGWVRPPWIAALYWAGAPADFVMARDMLRGIEERAERPPAR